MIRRYMAIVPAAAMIIGLLAGGGGIAAARTSRLHRPAAEASSAFAGPGILREWPGFFGARPRLKVGSSSELDGVFCTTSANCWAVGYYVHNGHQLALTLHWNGTKWSQVQAPSPGTDAELFGVRCTSAGNCWAVGDDDNKQAAELSLVLHWNGSRWSQVAAPNPAGTLKDDTNGLDDVACASPGDCWADGGYGEGDGSPSETLLNFILHWNGRAWSQVKAPDPGGTGDGHVSVITSLRCTSPGNCWAVGGDGTIGTGLQLANEVLHWNGKKWSNVPVFSSTKALDYENVLDSLSCTNADSCWAAGVTFAHTTLVNETMHWNGTKWREVATPSPKHAFGQLNAISCGSASDCWAVGEISASGSFNEVLHWTNHKWSMVTVPQPGGTADDDTNELLGLRCTSTTNCWAVGQDHKENAKEQAELLHLTGGKWVVG
jgi:hypothetical protein